MTRLECLTADSEKAALKEAAFRRYSCHTFSDPLSLGDWSALSFLCGRYTLPGVRTRLVRTDESLFPGTLLSFGRIAGCRSVILLSGTPTHEHLILCGFLGECLTLHAVALGLSACWVTGGYSRRHPALTLEAGESLLALIALGYAGEKPPQERRRKDLSKLCAQDPSAWPAPFLEAARLVQAAPSSGNAQPFLMGVHEGSFWLDSSERTRLELGIGVCHASLAFTQPYTWSFPESHQEPMARCRF